MKIQWTAFILIISSFFVGCGIEVSTTPERVGNYASYEIYRMDPGFDLSPESGELIDSGCISLDADNTSITTILTDDLYDDQLTFEYSLIGSDLEYGFTANSYDREMRSTSKYYFMDSLGQREVSLDFAGDIFVAVVEGNHCPY